MKEDWERSIAFVLQHEGDYSNDPKDPGGETKYGICKRSYPQLDIARLTIDEAKEIYRRDYWNAVQADELPWPLSLMAFDMGVNMGLTTARRMLQLALDVEVDGHIGEKTIAAAKRASDRRCLRYLAMRQARYARLMHENPTLFAFDINWSFRVLSLARLTAPVPGVM